MDLRDNDLPTYIRLHTGGLESDYMLTKHVESIGSFDLDDFNHYKWEYWLRKGAILQYFILGLFEFEIDIKEESNELERDIVGFDTYGAVRHLFRPTMNFYRYTRHEDLTVEENLSCGAYIRRDRTQIKYDIEKCFSYFPVLKERRKRLAGYLSGGEQQMLAISRALLAQPKLMMLDEPSLGLAPLLVREIFEIIKRINQEQNTTILLVEQNARLALGICNYAYIMESGRIVLAGEPETLKDNADVREFYLGLTEVGQRKSYRDVKHYKRRKRWLS
jgi:ABC-type polar amino acid transport system ATPase subunit